MDFLAPAANFTVHTRAGTYVSNSNSIIPAVTGSIAIADLLAAGCIPLTPQGWIDPR